MTEKLLTFCLEHIDTILTISVTIVGFIFSYFLNKKNFRHEIIKNKIALNTEVIKNLPYKIIQLMDIVQDSTSKTTKNKQPDLMRKYKEIVSEIISYGSADAIKIVVDLQQKVYSNELQEKENKLYGLVYYSLLICQIKFDLSSEVISPLTWLEIKLTDYKEYKDTLVKFSNDLVRRLKLNKQFLIK